MKILVTNFRLAERTGSEMVVLELACGLKARGHEVAVYTPEIGRVGEILQRVGGIPVVTRLEEVPFVPEVIHGQHLVPATLAILAFPTVPALYYCHGYGPLEERPPVHPRVRRWLAPSVRFRSWFAEEFGIPEERFGLVPNFVDTMKFHPRLPAEGEPGVDRPPGQRALLYHTNLRRGQEVATLEKACAEAGWTFEAVGSAFGGGTDKPEALLPGYDLVFTSGRSALEALACGCQVMIVGEGRIGPLLTPETIAAAMEVNFASISEHGELTAEAVRAGLADATAGLGHREAATQGGQAGWTVCRMVRESYSLDFTLDRLEHCYRLVVEEGVPAAEEADALTDRTALCAALETAAAALAQNRQETARLRAGWEETKRKREAVAKELAELKEKLRVMGQARQNGGGVWGRVWRAIRGKG